MDTSAAHHGRCRSATMVVLLLACVIACLLPAAASAAGPSTKIVGGTVVPDVPTNWPYIAAVGYQDDPFCGGTLIASRWVLTAAHCEFPETVTIGRKNLAGTGGQDIDIADWVTHPDWDFDTQENDIQLLLLNTVPTNPQPLPLATAADDPASGATVKVAGWGATSPSGGMVSNLREAQVEIVDNGTCDADYAADDLDVFPTMLCAAHTGRDTCYGDSGGPLVTSTPGGDRLAGITSWGIGCAEATHPGVYTRVSSFKTWIESYLRRFASFSSSYLDFYDIPAGSSETQQGAVRNYGDQNLTISGLSLVNSASEFTLVSNDCTPGKVLAPLEQCNYAVSYSPTVAEDESDGELELQSDSADGAKSVYLYGYSSEAPPLPPFVPTPPVVKETPVTTFAQSGKAKRKGRSLRAKFKFAFPLHAHPMSDATCGAKVEFSFTPPHSKSWARAVLRPTAGKQCSGSVTVSLPRSARGKKVAIHYWSLGNDVINPYEQNLKLKLK